MSQTFELEASAPRAPRAQPIAPNRPSPSPLTGEGGRLNGYKVELDGFRAMVVAFGDLDSSEVLGQISGIAGRVAEIRADLVRVNTPRCARLRTSEVDPLRDDLEFQFKLISRRIAFMEWEWRVSGGGI